ncbi:MAG: endonuclease I, partial [Bacteroidetes bacterium]
DNFVYFSSTQDLDIIIYDILGKQVLIENVNSTKDFINVSNLNKGIYLVKINSSQGAIPKKLIRQ